MKEFFKMMFASMLGFILVQLILAALLFGIIITIVSFSSKDIISISPKTVLLINLDKPVVDRSPKNPFFFTGNSIGGVIGLNDILQNIRKAKEDPDIKGIYLDISVIPGGLTTIDEIREALKDFRMSGKFVIAYSEMYSQPAYYLASVSDKIYLHPEGMLIFKGINADLMFLKGTLDKLDIRMQVVKHGKYKSATEPFVSDRMSAENRQQIAAIIGNVWQKMAGAISEERDIMAADLDKMADSLKIHSPEMALRYGLVDRLVYKDELLKELKKLVGLSDKQEIKTISIEKYTDVPSKKNPASDLSKIAVIYATGEITGGEGDDETIGSERLSKTIRKARENEKIKAIVLRVNSPGGSALASDVIWREVALAAKAKPVVASMGDVAASGGYYISCPATKIIANPTTITGSIGVLALIPDMKGFFNNKLGITFDNEMTNANSDFISINRPMTAYHEMVLRREIEDIYDTFITHVSEGRHMTKAKVDSIGQGRIWSGNDALRLGLVDDTGGMKKAVETAARLAGIKEYRVVELPVQKDPIEQILDELMGNTSLSVLEKELGENYRYIRYLKMVQGMKGIQMRLPCEIILN